MNFRRGDFGEDKAYESDRLTDEQLDKVIAMYKAYKTGKDIAAELGVPLRNVYEAIHKWKKLAGWEFEWSERNQE